MTPAVGDVYEDRTTPGRRIHVVLIPSATTLLAVAEIDRRGQQCGAVRHITKTSLARHWVRVDTTEEA